MIDAATLLLFVGAVAVLLLSPGPSMAFVLAHGVALGWRGGVAAAAGICAADVTLTGFTAAGITALVARWPPSFQLIRLGGASYLFWMAWSALRSPAGLVLQRAGRSPLRTVAWRAMLGSLLNPAALMFFMMFLPQFADVRSGALGLQLLTLGLILSALAAIFHAGLGALGGSVARLVSTQPAVARWRSRVFASVLALLALRLLVMPQQLH